MTARRRNLIYKVLLFVFAFTIAFLPSTASRNKEVNSRVVVEILGVDGANEITVTAQYVMPADGEGAAKKSTVSVTAPTVNDAVNGINTALGRRAELGHCSMVVVGADTVPSTLCTLLTATDITADVQVCAASGKAQELVGDITKFMMSTGATDAKFIAFSAHREHIATNTLLGFLSDVYGASKSAYLPIVQMSKSEQGDEQGDEQGGEQGGEQSEEQSGEQGMSVKELALYRDDGRAGVLGEVGARGVAWVRAHVEKGSICADVEYDGKIIKGVCGRMIDKKCKVKVDPNARTATVEIKATVEPNGDKFNALHDAGQSAVDALIRGYKDSIVTEVTAAVSECEKLNCDALLLGSEFYRYYPDYFESTFSLSGTQVICDVRISIK